MEKQHGYELENMDYQAKLNEEMAQRNQQRQNEYFGMTAEYNSAKNQKQRLIDAGLNPALMYGAREVVEQEQEAREEQAETVSDCRKRKR